MESMQANIEQLEFDQEQRAQETLKSIPQKSKIDELNREISDLKE
jgi:serine/threonine-protein kinase RIO1